MTERNQSSRLVWTSCSPYTGTPPSTRRRFSSATVSRVDPTRRVTDSTPGLRVRLLDQVRGREQRRGRDRIGAFDADHGIRTAQQLLDRTLADHPATVDDGDGVARALHFVEEVRGEHDGAPLRHEAVDHVADLVHAGGVETVHGFVEDEQFGVAQEARGHAEPLAHAHGVAADLVVSALAQTHPLERRPDALVSPSPTRGGEQLEVLASADVSVEAGLVDDGADPGQGLGAVAWNGDAEQGHGAAVGMGEAEQGADQCGLAGPVRPEVPERRPTRDEELDVVDGHLRPETLGQAMGLDGPLAVAADRRVVDERHDWSRRGPLCIPGI